MNSKLFMIWQYKWNTSGLSLSVSYPSSASLERQRPAHILGDMFLPRFLSSHPCGHSCDISRLWSSTVTHSLTHWVPSQHPGYKRKASRDGLNEELSLEEEGNEKEPGLLKKNEAYLQRFRIKWLAWLKWEEGKSTSGEKKYSNYHVNTLTPHLLLKFSNRLYRKSPFWH